MHRVGLKGLHGFEFHSAAPRPLTVCLTAIFGKIGRKYLNQVMVSQPYGLTQYCLFANSGFFTPPPLCGLHIWKPPLSWATRRSQNDEKGWDSTKLPNFILNFDYLPTVHSLFFSSSKYISFFPYPPLSFA